VLLAPCHLYTARVMFKVYIVGDAIRVVCRFSLPNVDEGDLSNNAGVF
jgi:inositol-1,3,4-trisphosphate 5/6-kinase / inositol-tetrakisphosphate 1-kinase